MSRVFGGTITLAVLVFFASCTKKGGDSQKQAQEQATIGSATPVSAVAGIHWKMPPRWVAQPDRPMRTATYTVPSLNQKDEAGECGVFYFAGGQGGNVQDNLNRWISQFEKGGNHEFSTKEVNGLKVTIIHIEGTYLSAAGPMMQQGEKKANYRLLGAIVEGPQGSVFFKFTGPISTVTASESEFTDLINSIAKDQA